MLLERDRELALLTDLLAGLESSGGKVVLVRGEAGIGKSSLVKDFTDRHADEAHVHFGFCDDLSTPQPLGPFWDVAREEPSLAEPLERGERPAVLAAIIDLLSGSLRPNILVIEDLQWADEATLDAIKYVGRRIARTNGLLLLTYREGEVDYDHPLRGVIGELPPQNLTRIHLDRLSAAAVAFMVEAADLKLDKVLALTDGNPLFVTEVLASGVDDVPSSIQDSVLARAAKLSGPARRILDLVSVIPGTAERSLIENILQPAQEHLSECTRQGLLQVDDFAMSFTHELTRRSIESALSITNRRRLNGQVLEELAEWADPSRLVHHAREADEVESVIELAPKAARAAMAIASYREARAHFLTLEPYLDRIPEDRRAGIIGDWARTEFYLDNVEAVDIFARAIELHRSRDDDVSLAQALTFAVRVYEINGRPEAAEAFASEAVAILDRLAPGPDLAFALATHAWLALMRSDNDRALQLAEQALALAEATGDDLSMIHALNTKGYGTYMRGDGKGLTILEDARERAERGGYPFEEIRALINMAGAALEKRELDRLADMAQRARETASRYELPVLEAYAQVLYAQALHWKGEWAAAADIASEVLGSHPHTDRVAGNILGIIQARQGRAEARATLEVTWRLTEAGGELQTLAPVATAFAEYLWLTGEEDGERLARFREILHSARRFGHDWEAASLAFWLWKSGELSEVPAEFIGPHRLVIEGKPRDAAAMWARMGFPYERAISLTHGDEKAQLEALDILETLGAAAVAAKLRKSLRDQGLSVPRGKGRATRSNAAGLTARQAEVLQLLDKGLSNLEIADRLFVSPRTVENHVSAILSKLESSTREEAVQTASQRGLLPTG